MGMYRVLLAVAFPPILLTTERYLLSLLVEDLVILFRCIYDVILMVKVDII